MMTKDKFIKIILIALFCVIMFGGYRVIEIVQVPAEISAIATTTPSEIRHGDTSKNQIIFTFDGGGGIQSGQKILEALAKHNVKSTFFLTGQMVERNPEFVKNIASAGHEIFSHTFDHLDLTKLSDEDIRGELVRTEDILQASVGKSSKPYFRAPFGARDARVLSVAGDIGYQSVYWSEDALDWDESRGVTTSQVKDRIISTLAPGHIYLMHVGDNITGEILDEVFTEIESRGYKIVSLTQGL